MGRAREVSWSDAVQAVPSFTAYSLTDHATALPVSMNQVSSEQLLQTASRLLRVLLSYPAPVLHSQLRAKVLPAEEDSERSKCLFEVAVMSLSDQGLLLRHGFGGCNTALYSIPDAARGRAEDIAFREFPDDSRFVYTARSVAARVPCSLSRRHGSPRQLAGRMRGVEKSSGVRGRSKRAAGGDDLSQLQKRKKLESAFEGYVPMSP